MQMMLVPQRKYTYVTRRLVTGTILYVYDVRHRQQTSGPPEPVTKTTDSVVFSPQANYTDWVTATCRRNLVPSFTHSGLSRGESGGSLTVVDLSFLDRSRYFSSK
jgi:hypothetical protein